MARKPRMLVTGALANEMDASWAVLANDEDYRVPIVASRPNADREGATA
jgi:hypothetical protein